MSVPSETKRVFLSERPKGHISDTTFKNETAKLPTPNADQVVVRVDYVSLDPAMRGWLNDTRSYVPPVQIGETMRAGGIGTVVKGNDKLKAGDVVQGTLGWAEYIVVATKGLRKLSPPEGSTAIDYLGPLGMTGMTAYFGLLEVGHIKAGETLVVSGAAGATGSLVCQIGKLKGAKVIAIASGPKCAYLRDELGVDAALDYKSPTFAKDFRSAVGYLDVFFDNVGGEILDLALTRLNKGARIALCGAISAYNSAGQPEGIKNYLTLISQRAKIEGFIVFDYQDKFAQGEADMAKWINEGKLKRKYQIEEGLEQCPQHLGLLFSGGNTGKLLVKISKEASKY
ncbi:alcohol dehydrogenase [Ceratobasidium sp. AG-I]|nr:alcohol dehydrogenase [Ceratobasidium sp. AG-I]